MFAVSQDGFGTQAACSPESRCCLVLTRLVFWTTQQRWSMANMARIITTLWSSRVSSNCFPILQGCNQNTNHIPEFRWSWYRRELTEYNLKITQINIVFAIKVRKDNNNKKTRHVLHHNTILFNYMGFIIKHVIQAISGTERPYK